VRRGKRRKRGKKTKRKGRKKYLCPYSNSVNVTTNRASKIICVLITIAFYNTSFVKQMSFFAFRKLLTEGRKERIR
jgi:transcription elongation factor Elf1